MHTHIYIYIHIYVCIGSSLGCGRPLRVRGIAHAETQGSFTTLLIMPQQGDVAECGEVFDCMLVASAPSIKKNP